MPEIKCKNCGHPVYKIRYRPSVVYDHYHPHWHPYGLDITSTDCFVEGCDCKKPEPDEGLGIKGAEIL